MEIKYEIELNEVVAIVKSIDKLEEMEGLTEEMKKELEIIKSNVTYDVNKALMKQMGVFGF